LANLSGRTDYHPTITCEHIPSLVDIVRNTDAIGVATEEFFGQELQRGELVRLYWRNLPTTLDESMLARCGIVSRAGYRLSAAARAMIAMIVEVDSELGLGAPPVAVKALQANAFA
jgi:DNA-binding transcriptional LysR family regulator